MRCLSIMIVAGLLMGCGVAMAAEEEASQGNMPRFRLSVDPGYLWVTGNDRDVLKNGAAFGLSAGYRLSPSVEVTLPLLMSFLKGNDLPDGQAAKLDIFSITPGFTFSTTKKLCLWFFMGLGVTSTSARVQVFETSATESKTNLGARIGAGINYTIWNNLSVGVNGAVLTATGNFLQPNDTTKWSTSFYYALLGEVAYAF